MGCQHSVAMAITYCQSTSHVQRKLLLFLFLAYWWFSLWIDMLHTHLSLWSSFHLGHKHINCRAFAAMLTMSCTPMCIYRYSACIYRLWCYIMKQYVGYRPLTVHRRQINSRWKLILLNGNIFKARWKHCLINILGMKQANGPELVKTT